MNRGAAGLRMRSCTAKAVKTGRRLRSCSPRAWGIAKAFAARILVATAATLIVFSVSAFAKDACYEDVVVRSGPAVVNGRYSYVGIQFDRPVFIGPGSCLLLYQSGRWQLFVNAPPPHVQFSNNSSSYTPPSSGWYAVTCDVSPCPAPRLSGGASCPEETEPAVEIALDVGMDLPEGEEPPRVGSLPLAAEYCLGQEIGLDVVMVDENGDPIPDAQAAVALYAVSITEDEENREVIVRVSGDPDRRTGRCHIELASDGLAPGIYDLRVRLVPDVMDPVYLRIRLSECLASGGQATSCYNQIVVRGAGEQDANGTYRFGDVDDSGRPVWEARRDWTGVGGQRQLRGAEYGTARIRFVAAEQAWEIVLEVWVGSSPTLLYLYINESTAATPPASGWARHPADILHVLGPVPTLTGGELCDFIPQESTEVITDQPKLMD